MSAPVNAGAAALSDAPAVSAVAFAGDGCPLQRRE
jgi:hypothetical protein